MKGNGKIKQIFKDLFTFSPQQRRGILLLLPLLAVVGVLIAVVNRPHFEKSFLELADEAVGLPGHGARIPGEPHDGHDAAEGIVQDVPVPELFRFDPNTVTLQELSRLGFDTRTAAGIIKYREHGKRFEIPEDFATCYGVSMEEYTRLEPYIVIGEEFRVRSTNRERHVTSAVNSGDGSLPAPKLFDPNFTDAAGFVELGFSPAQAEVIIRYRNSLNGFITEEDFANCYVVSEEMMERLRPYIKMEPPLERKLDKPVPVNPPWIEINSADSVSLRQIWGVGDVLVVRIMEYREQLGGFASANQLAEIKGMTEANRELICKQIRVDSCEIQKIDVNFAPHKTLVEQMGNHPYVTDVMLRRILKNRQLKGGWSTIGDMVNENIMTQKEAEKLSPYLVFRSE